MGLLGKKLKLGWILSTLRRIPLNILLGISSTEATAMFPSTAQPAAEHDLV